MLIIVYAISSSFIPPAHLTVRINFYELKHLFSLWSKNHIKYKLKEFFNDISESIRENHYNN